ncbi:MAG: hypothetical protein ABI462_11165, partial [Ignavibacteria bacterium]
MKKITFLLILSFCCSTAFSQWERTTGPEGSSIEFLTNIDGKIYAGTNGDGVFQSTNAGSNWIPLNTGMEYENVRSVVLKSGDLFAGSFQNGVFKSTNGGESWIPPAPENRFKVYDLLVKDNYIFAGSQGLYRSSDNGNTWELSPYIFQFAQTSICSSGENIFVASYGDMEKSTDNGDTFTKQFQFESQAIFSLYSLDSMVFVGSSNKIYRSVDHGENFEQINIPFPFSIVNIYDFAYVGSTL